MYYKSKPLAQDQPVDSVRLVDCVHILNFRPILCYALWAFTIMVFLFKVTMAVIDTMTHDLASELPFNPVNLELYFLVHANFENYLKTFGPNFVVVLTINYMIQIKAHRYDLKQDELEDYKMPLFNQTIYVVNHSNSHIIQWKRKSN